MSDVEDLAEWIADLVRWAADHPESGTAQAVAAMPPVAAAEVEAVEAKVRMVDPSGLPARCDSCHRRLPMIQRSDGRHPKCPHSTEGTES